MAQAKQKTSSERPLSPHLQIYSFQINMVMSMLHRLTGSALYLGSALLAWWLIAAATGPQYFEFVNGLFNTTLGRLVLLGYTWALLHHMFGGIRHLIWDTGRGFSLPAIDRLSWLTIILSTLGTIVVWAIALSLRGGL